MTDVIQNHNNDLPGDLPADPSHDHVRTGLDAEDLREAIADHLRYSIGRPAAALQPEHYYRALALAVRDRMQDNRVASTQTSLDLGRKVTCYLSAEFLMGPQLGDNLLNLGIEDAARAALQALGQDLDEVLACEEEPGLGNGGLGRLAACYLDSLATLERPAIGYGIRYEFGIFEQEIPTAGRSRRPTTGWPTETLGRSPSPTSTTWSTGVATPSTTSTTQATTASAGCRSRSSRASPTTPRSRATACTPATC